MTRYATNGSFETENQWIADSDQPITLPGLGPMSECESFEDGTDSRPC